MTPAGSLAQGETRRGYGGSERFDEGGEGPDGNNKCQKTGKSEGFFRSDNIPDMDAECWKWLRRACPPDGRRDYIRVQVCDLQSILRTQPCIFSEAPLIDALPL